MGYGDVSGIRNMKKMMFFVVMLVCAVVANAQRIADMGMENGQRVIYLENGQKIFSSSIPNSNRFRRGETIQQGLARTQYEDYAAEASKYCLTSNTYGYGAAMYPAVYGGMYPVYGGSGSTFSIGNEHWGFSTGSSEFGGYKSSGTSLRIGSFQIGSTKSGYTQPSYNNGTSYEAVPTASQKKADAKVAAKRYSQMRTAGGVTTSASNGNGNGKTLHITNGGASVLLY